MADLFDFGDFPILETPRLILRRIVPEDVEAIFAIRGDYEVTRLNIGPAYPDVGYAVNLIRAMEDSYAQKNEIRWGITLRDEDVVIGMVGYNYWVRPDGRASVGYDLLRDAWGNGIMPEALLAIIDFGWDCMDLNRIEADCSGENYGSIRVLEKVGFTLEGRQREQFYDEEGYHDLLLWGLLRRDCRP